MMENVTVNRPILRYHGSKFLLADWIISFFPDHKLYCEPYGGTASVLLKKSRSTSEVYNDLNDEIVNLFRVCRDHPKEIISALYLTPFSRDEFNLSYHPTDDPVERARRTVIRSFMGFGGGVQSSKVGFKSNSIKTHTPAPVTWATYPDELKLIIDRMRGVMIENRNGLEVIDGHDSKETLFYLDPPYMKDTRYLGKKTKIYAHEMEDFQHEELLKHIRKIKGMTVISGYDTEVYNDILFDWRKESIATVADAGTNIKNMDRTEVLWISPNCRQTQLKIF
jgi:DNA adenine methylase